MLTPPLRDDRRPIMSTSLRRAARVVLTAALLTAAPAPAAAGPAAGPAAAATGVVVGVLDDDGTPVPDAVVDLLLPNGAPRGQVRTDAEGRFRFADVPPATYLLRFSLQGGLVQFFPGRLVAAEAKQIRVLAGREFVADETVAPHGRIGGLITTDGGAPAPGARVRLHSADGREVAAVLTGPDGGYRFAYTPTGRFTLAVAAAERGATYQWAPRRRTRAQATPVTLAKNVDSRLDERLLPSGMITGRFTRDGVPIANVTVVAHSQATTADTVSHWTAADGTFRLLPYPGAYKVEFRVPTRMDLLDQWAGGAESERTTAPVRVAAGEEVSLDERALPTGRLSGRLAAASGGPPGRVGVSVSDPTRDRQYQATTAEDGTWFRTVRPGSYAVRYSTATQSQWAVGRTSRETADPVVVPAGGATTVDDTFLATGALTVTAADARTGAPLTSFCADVQNGYTFLGACTEDGTVKIGEIGAGTYEVKVTDGVRLDAVTRDVRVIPGRRTTASARLSLATGFAVTLVDAVTGEPVRSGCVTVLPADRAAEPGQGIGGCVDDTGRATMDQVVPDRYVLFAAAYDDVHGAQWVGTGGGVGARADARVFTAAGGETVDVTVRLDGRGAIAGRVTDADTGDPVPRATVGVWGAATSTEEDGTYLLDGLGPYRWTVYTQHDDYAGQWSGGGNDRLTATRVSVAEGASAPFDVGLGRGTTVTGTVATADGRVPDQSTVWVIDALTFDELATGRAGADGRYTVHVAGPRDVKLLVESKFGVLWTIGWHAGPIAAPDFATAAVVPVPVAGALTRDVTAPGPRLD
jgi:protocatechuate 3,4-dioxygenase beta subunit